MPSHAIIDGFHASLRWELARNNVPDHFLRSWMDSRMNSWMIKRRKCTGIKLEPYFGPPR